MAKDRIVMPSGDKPSFGDQLPPKQVSWRAQMPRFVVEVDGQAKSGFAERELAEAEAKRISDAFPKLQVKVVDWETDSVRTLGATQGKPEAEAE
jgi:hypothetical protein